MVRRIIDTCAVELASTKTALQTQITANEALTIQNAELTAANATLTTQNAELTAANTTLTTQNAESIKKCQAIIQMIPIDDKIINTI